MNSNRVIGNIILEGAVTAEDSIIIDGKNSKRVQAQATLQDLDVINRNRRIYAKADMAPEINGPRMQELIRAKNRINLKGKNNGMYGKHHSKETIQKIINNRDLSIYHTEASKKKMSKVTKGENNGMYGRHHTEESKKKMSENSKGKSTGSANGNFGNKGDKAKNGKKCYCYLDEEHKILFKEFNTLDLALNFLNMKGHTGILKAIKNNKKYKGYYWSR